MRYLVTSEPYHDNSLPLAPFDDAAEAIEFARQAVEENFSARVWQWDGLSFKEVGSWFTPPMLGRKDADLVWIES